MEMEPIVLGCPPFSSPDPTTRATHPLTDGSTAQITGEAHDEAGSEDDLKAADWVAMVEGAADQDALDEVVEKYEESGADYKTVAAAIENKQTEIDNG